MIMIFSMIKQFLFSDANTVTFEMRTSLEHLNKLLQHLFLVAKHVSVGERRNQHCVSFYGLWSIHTQGNFEFVIVVWHVKSWKFFSILRIGDKNLGDLIFGKLKFISLFLIIHYSERIMEQNYN